MGESEGGGDSKFMSGFLVGFVVGVLVCLGVGGSFMLVSTRHNLAAQAAMEEARAARDMAVMESRRAEVERARALKAAADLKAAKEKGEAKDEADPKREAALQGVK